MTNYSSLPYSAGLMSQSFWFVEFKAVLRMIANGKSDEEIKQISLSENLFGAPNEYRSRRICGYLLSRSKAVDADLLHLFLNADVDTQKLINLVAILRGDRLFFEFVYEVYREKAYLGQLCLETLDVNSFFTRKGQQSDSIEIWNDTTKKKLKGIYFNFLTDAGLLRKENRVYFIKRIVPDDRLLFLLKRADELSLQKAITGEM